MVSQPIVSDERGENCEFPIALPCLNEVETLSICIDKARAFLKSNNIHGEIIVSDNGSIDGSQQIAIKHGARAIDIPIRGYGAALMGCIKAARGRYVIMGDADDSYSFNELHRSLHFIAQLLQH